MRYAAKNLVSPIEVDTRIPGWIDRLPVDYRQDQGASLIDDAFYAIKLDAIADNQALRRIRNTEILAELTLYRANLLAVEANVMAGAADAGQLAEALEHLAAGGDRSRAFGQWLYETMGWWEYRVRGWVRD